MDNFFFNEAPECLIIIDKTSRIIDANKKAFLFFGKSINPNSLMSEMDFNNSIKENIFSPYFIASYFEFNFENREVTFRSSEGYLFHFLLSSKIVEIENVHHFYISLKNVTDFISYKNIFEELYNSLSTKTIELDKVLADKEKAYKFLKIKDDEMLRQLKLAREVQIGLFPEVNKKYGKYSTATKMLPASAISGDMVVFYEKSNTCLEIIMADVTGHGIPAALITMLLKMSLQGALASFEDPIYVLDQINKDIHAVLSNSAIFATILFTKIDLITGEILIVNCGHPSPILLKKDGTFLQQPIGGMLLGVVGNLDFDIYSYNFELGDSLILFTDGLTEASNDKNVFFEDEFYNVVKNNASSLPSDIIDQIIKSLIKHTGTSELQDDISIVCIKRD